MGCYNSAVINAPIDKVWEALSNFHDLSAVGNVITSLEAVGEVQGDQPGAKRVLNGAFHETLVEIDNAGHTFTYSIDDGPGPLESDKVDGYRGHVQMFPVTADGSTFVLWTSVWESSQGGVADFCNPIYHALLSDLKATFES